MIQYTEEVVLLYFIIFVLVVIWVGTFIYATNSDSSLSDFYSWAIGLEPSNFLIMKTLDMKTDNTAIAAIRGLLFILTLILHAAIKAIQHILIFLVLPLVWLGILILMLFAIILFSILASDDDDY